MRYLLFLFLIVSACSSEVSHEELIKHKFESYYLPKMDDPDSYEFVSIENIDTSYWTESEQTRIKGMALFGITQDQKDSLKNVLERRRNEKDIAFYEVELKARGNNKMGAKVLSSFFARFNTEWGVISVEQAR